MKVLLNNIAIIQSGYHFKEKIENDKNGNIKFIQLKDIDEYNKIDLSNLWKNKFPNIKVNQLLVKGDILIKCRSTNFTASVVDEDVENTIATSHFFIVRLTTNNIIPEYFVWFINDAPTQKIIKSGLSGTHMQLMNKKLLENIEIIIPSIEIQQEIIKIKNLKEREQKLLSKKIELKNLLIDLQLRKIINKR
jgi:restriction endonuclease S subunit